MKLFAYLVFVALSLDGAAQPVTLPSISANAGLMRRLPTTASTQKSSDALFDKAGRYSKSSVEEYRRRYVQDLTVRIAEAQREHRGEDAARAMRSRTRVLQLPLEDVCRLLRDVDERNALSWKEFGAAYSDGDAALNKTIHAMVERQIVRAAVKITLLADATRPEASDGRTPIRFTYRTKLGLIREYDGWVQVGVGKGGVAIPIGAEIGEGDVIGFGDGAGVGQEIFEAVIPEITLYELNLAADPPIVTEYKSRPFK